MFEELEQHENRLIKRNVEHTIKILKEIRKQCKEEGLELSADQVIKLTHTAAIAWSLDCIADSIVNN